MIAQGLSWLGALLILGAYAAQQAAWMRAGSIPHALLNLIGGALVAAVAGLSQQHPVVVLEGTWAAISAVALIKALRARADRPGSLVDPG